jgi:hypothetical protein
VSVVTAVELQSADVDARLTVLVGLVRGIANDDEARSQSTIGRLCGILGRTAVDTTINTGRIWDVLRRLRVVAAT